MTRLFTDGAEFRDMLAWTAYSSATYSTGVYRSGTASYQMSNGHWAQYNITSASEIYLRFGLYIDNNNCNGTLIRFKKDATVLDTLYVVDASRLLRAYSGDSSTILATGTHSISINTWHLIEIRIKIDDSPNGIYTVYLNNTLQMSFTGDTKPGADTQMNSIAFYGIYGGTTYFDDIAINNSEGTVDNSWCGDGRIIILTPSGSGTTNSWLNSGSVSGSANYSYVDEFPNDGDTTYAYASGSSSGDQDQYALSNWVGDTNVIIQRIYPECRAKVATSSESTIKLGYLPSGGSDQMSGSIALSTNYAQVLGTSASTNPVTGLPWTISDLNALEYVIEVT